MSVNQHELYMKKVFELARKGTGHTSPNPLVGALLVKDGTIISSGYHEKIGRMHAEKMAIEKAGDAAEGADLYINLEPCFHYGRTPPCVDLIIEKKIKRVIFSNLDPNPLINGQSIKKLRFHGIEVIEGVLENEGYYLNEVFLKFIATQQPFVVLKAAISLDGKIATSGGESKWITGKDARKDGHYLRQKYDAIMTGINTVIADDPELTCRIPGGRNPYRIILDTNLRIPEEAKILKHEDATERTIIFCGGRACEEKAARLKKSARIIKLAGDYILPEQVLNILSEMNIAGVLIEGGAQIHGSFIRAGLVDKFYLYYSPILIGGQNAPGFFGGDGFRSLSETVKLQIFETKKIGNDLRIALYPDKQELRQHKSDPL